MKDKLSKKDLAKEEMIISVFRKMVEENKHSANPIPTSPPPPHIVAMAMANGGHVESLGNLHIIVVPYHE